MRDLALFEWSGLIFANDTSDARYHVSHFRQRRVSFLRIRDAAEILSQLKGHFWDVFSVECLIGKLHPISSVDSGTQFPVGAPLGKCVPLRPPRVGCTFRKAPQRETTSHSKGKFRDAFFESLPIRKARPTLDASGHGTIDLSGLPSIKRRPPGRRGTKFIASSARKEGHLMWPSSCAGLPEQQT